MNEWPLGEILMRTRHRRFVAPDVTKVTKEANVQLPLTKSRMLYDLQAGGTDTVGAGPTLATCPLTVRVLFLRVDGKAGDYLSHRIHMLIQRDTNGGGVRMYGGAWSKEDGDPADPATPRKTAVRVLKENCGVANEALVFAPLLEIAYVRGGGERTRTVVLTAVVEGETGRAVRIAPCKVIGEEGGAATRIPAEYNIAQMRRTACLPNDENFELTIAVDMLWDTYEELMVGRIVSCLKRARIASEEAKVRAEQKEAFTKERREAQEAFILTLKDLSAEDAAAKKAEFEGEWDKRYEELVQKLGDDDKKEFDQTLADSFAFLENPALASTHCLKEEQLKNVLMAARVAPTMQGVEEFMAVLSAHRQSGILSYAHVLQVPPDDLLPQEKEFEIEPDPEPEPEQEPGAEAADPSPEADPAAGTPMDVDVPTAQPAAVPAPAPTEEVPQAAPAEEQAKPMAVDTPTKEPAAPALTKEEVEGMSFKELQAQCKARGLKAIGKTAELKERLIQAGAE